MTITYQKYPLLLFLSYDINTAPDEIPFVARDNDAMKYLQDAAGLHELFAYIVAKKGFTEKKHVNYFLPDELFLRIDSDDQFRNKYFAEFFNGYITPVSGTILFRGGGQYCFVLLGKHETKELKKVDGRYIAAGLFVENNFVGFEEALITEKGVEMLQTGYYSNGMDVGGYISFVIVFLAYLHGKNDLPLVAEEINKTTETIYQLQ